MTSAALLDRLAPSGALWQLRVARAANDVLEDSGAARVRGRRAVHPVLDAAMDLYSRGDDGAFEVVYGHAAQRVRGLLLRMCGSRLLAEDLTQETFLRVSRARGRFEEGAAALPWMLAIARNTYLDFSRRTAARDRGLIESAACVHGPACRDTHADEVLMGREMLAVVCAALARLTARQREAFVLVRFEGLSIVQAARVLGATETAVKLRAHRAYEALRAAIEAYRAGEEHRHPV